ncbi:pentatricopeptide repeat-containing protein At2g06000 [Cryptomeria japonica]|uniref:pentatricopeptide repeat-containing protein At2g06000 n=1 Tax=Cryptomeria japonica TaxID=3369 RepID=UPI0027DA6196|nr:pentatricopeptide repeat-containing protein At2g06000 [Cryptomeria japonica]
MLRLSFSSSPQFPSFIFAAYKQIAAARYTFSPFCGSNPRPEEAESPENNSSTGSEVVESICNLLKQEKLPTFELTGESAVKRLTLTLTPEHVLNVISGLNDAELGLKFFRYTKAALKFKHIAATYDHLISSLLRAGLNESARELLEDLKDDGYDISCKTLMEVVTSLATTGKIDQALDLFEKAPDFKCSLSLVCYNEVLNFLIEKGSVDKALGFFKCQLCKNVSPDSYSFNMLVKAFCSVGEVKECFKVLDMMKSHSCRPNDVTVNTFITGLCRVNRVDEGYRLLRQLHTFKHYRPNVYSYTAVIRGFCKQGVLGKAQKVFNEMIECRVRPNLVTYNVLIDGFCKEGNIDEAYSMFRKMKNGDVVTYTSMIDGYCKAGKTNDAIMLLHELSERGMAANAYTYSVMINGLCKENRLSEAHDLLKQMKERRIFGGSFIYNMVIDGYCKVGNVEQANKIFEEMKGRDRGCAPDKRTYTILIYGHCMKGRMAEAVSLFHEMFRVSCVPDEVTVQALVTSLVKASMLDEARSVIFTLLAKGITPGLSSCSSIINYLFRQWKIEDTEQWTKLKEFLDKKS